MKKLPDVLDEKILGELERKDEIIYFNYLGIDASKLSKKALQELSNGDSHAIVGDDLYIKVISSEVQYSSLKRGFVCFVEYDVGVTLSQIVQLHIFRHLYEL